MVDCRLAVVVCVRLTLDAHLKPERCLTSTEASIVGFQVGQDLLMGVQGSEK